MIVVAMILFFALVAAWMVSPSGKPMVKTAPTASEPAPSALQTETSAV
jgi:hypothetical protein